MGTLVVQELRSGYTGQAVISDVSIEVESGQIVSVLGANGAGKSTLLSVIAGLVKAWDGSVELDGEPLDGLSCEQRVRRGVVLVPEGHPVINPLTVMENLELGAIRFWPRTFRGRVAESLEMVFSLFPVLKDRRNQISAHLSGGEQQMLAIGRALMSQPVVMLLDEPSLGLAPSVTETVYGNLTQLKELGTGILLVEQDVGMALEASDTVHIMRLGNLVEHGSGHQIDDAAIRDAYLGVDTTA